MHHQIGQKGHLQQGGGQFDGEAVVVRPAALRNDLLHPGADLEDGVAGVELHLDGVFLGLSVLRRPQHHEAHRQLGTVVEFPVHDEPVGLRHLRDGPDIGGDDQLHKGDLHALPALVAHVAQQRLVFRVVGQKDLRVAAPWHQVRGDLNDGVEMLDPLSFGAASKHGHSSFLSPGFALSAPFPSEEKIIAV